MSQGIPFAAVELSDLERLVRVFESQQDKVLPTRLEKQRGRDGYPVRTTHDRAAADKKWCSNRLSLTVSVRRPILPGW